MQRVFSIPRRALAHSSSPAISRSLLPGDVQTPAYYDVVKKMFTSPHISSSDYRRCYDNHTGATPYYRFPEHLMDGPGFSPVMVNDPYNVGYFAGPGELAMSRSRVLNATNYNLLVRIAEWLTLVERNHVVRHAVWRGDHLNFSAGDDLQEVWEDKFKYKDTMRYDYYTLQFDISWYLLNMKTTCFAYLSGATVGPTVGYAAMANSTIATDTTQAMVPACAYGFVPTGGSTWLLSRLKGQLGIYMAMTADSLNGAHAFYAGVGKYYIPADRCDNFATMMCEYAPQEGHAMDYFVTSISEVPKRDDSFEELLYRVDSVFMGDSVEEFMERALEKGETEWYDNMKSFSPTSLRLSLEMITRARTMSKEQCLDMEKHVVFQLLDQDEFYEGIRGTVMYPDQPPQWGPTRQPSEFLDQFY